MPKLRPAATLGLLGIGALLVFLCHVGVGSYMWITPWGVAQEILRGPMQNPTKSNIVVWAIRLPRGLGCVCIGGILGVVGSAFQAQLRNRLAEPYVIGVASGAAVGGAIALLLGFDTALWGLGKSLSGFCTGILSLAIVVGIARRHGAVDRGTLLLAGVLIGALLSSILSMVLLAAGKDTNLLLSWLLGDISIIHPSEVLLTAVALLVGTTILITQSRRLNALSFGESTARRLGVDVARLTRIVLITGTAMTAVAVGAVGIIGFLGLVAPHVARRIIGVDWRWSLPGSLLCGSILLTASDLVAQRGLPLLTHTVGREPPVGIVTAILGAPVLLVLLKQRG